MECMSEIKRRDPILLEVHERYLSSQDTVSFVFAVREHYCPSTLERLVTHADCRVRRAAVFALGFVGDFETHQTVGTALLDVDRSVRSLAESACRRVWTRDGDKQQRRELMSVTRAIAAGRYEEAIKEADRLVSVVPHFAEVWYQRGAARFQLEDYARAIDDWTQTLELNAYHFVAATAMGAAFLRLNDPLSALKSLRRALLLNPDLENVREQVKELTREIEGE